MSVVAGTAAAVQELDGDQRAALDACVVAALALSSGEGEAQGRMRLLMECHGRYVRSFGVLEQAPSYGVFVRRLRGSRVADLLPGRPKGSVLGKLWLLDDDGVPSSALDRLAVEASDHGHQAPGIGADIRHLHSLLRAVGMLPVSTGLSRISGETVQHAVFRSLRAAGFEAYTRGREAMVRTPVLTRRNLSRNSVLVELGAYTGISPTRQFGGLWAACPMCGWTMRATYRPNGVVDIECEDERHSLLGARYRAEPTAMEGWSLAPYGELRTVPELLPVEGYVALPYALWLWVTLPGLLEVELRDRLVALGAEVRLWPFGDAYDLHVTRPSCSRAWRVDVKTWADPHGLAQKLREEPEGSGGLCFVVPEHLRGYLPLLRRVVRGGGARVLTDADLVAEVERA
ncbi:restriction endonuclease-related protein [Streptomyces diastaticus]|uniref:restriction endonuclease-related protein n=1 Tax=Streptomyces diastaticus TaxID=1956 RepID=UPI00366232C7